MPSPGSCSRRSGDSLLLSRPPPVADVGCGCRTPRVLSSIYSALMSRARGGGSRKPKSSHPSSTSTATAFSSSTTGGTTATTVSSLDDSWGLATYAANTLYEDDDPEARRQLRPRRRTRRHRKQRNHGSRRPERGVAMMSRGGEEEEAAVAVEVESATPYEDFRESMVAMVVEKEMYAWEDLNALLHGFLSLNSPRNHPLILHAFADLWAPRGGLFCPPSPCLGL
ncbi:hypothetical protein ZWY2020_044182 [Hordeum vulgare]|nr:hypothetical protein ZWY2020_044182 [Hordeum vulgare]